MHGTGKTKSLYHRMDSAGSGRSINGNFQGAECSMEPADAAVYFSQYYRTVLSRLRGHAGSQVSYTGRDPEIHLLSSFRTLWGSTLCVVYAVKQYGVSQPWKDPYRDALP